MAKFKTTPNNIIIDNRSTKGKVLKDSANITSSLTEDNKLFKEFIDLYLNYISQTDLPISKVYSILSNETEEYFLKDKADNTLPEIINNITNKPFLKNIRKFYLTRGSKASWEFLYNTIFNLNTRIKHHNPHNELLITSFGYWDRESGLYTEPNHLLGEASVLSDNSYYSNFSYAVKVDNISKSALEVTSELLHPSSKLGFIDRETIVDFYVNTVTDNLWFETTVKKFIKGEIYDTVNNLEEGNLHRVDERDAPDVVNEVYYTINGETGYTEIAAYTYNKVDVTDIKQFPHWNVPFNYFHLTNNLAFISNDANVDTSNTIVDNANGLLIDASTGTPLTTTLVQNRIFSRNPINPSYPQVRHLDRLTNDIYFDPAGDNYSAYIITNNEPANYLDLRNSNTGINRLYNQSSGGNSYIIPRKVFNVGNLDFDLQTRTEEKIPDVNVYVYSQVFDPFDFYRIQRYLDEHRGFIIRQDGVNYNLTNTETNPYVAAGETYGDIPTLRIGNRLYSRHVTDITPTADTITTVLNGETLYLASEITYQNPDNNIRTRHDIILNSYDVMADFEQAVTDFAEFHINEFDSYANASNYLKNARTRKHIVDFYSFTSFIGLDLLNASIAFITNKFVNYYQNRHFISVRTATAFNPSNPVSVFTGYVIDPQNPPILATVSTIEKLNHSIPKRYTVPYQLEFNVTLSSLGITPPPPAVVDYSNIANWLNKLSDYVYRIDTVNYNITNTESNPYVAVGETYGDIPTLRVGNKLYSRHITDITPTADTITSTLNNETLYLSSDILYVNPDASLKTRFDVALNYFTDMISFENKVTSFDKFFVNSFGDYSSANSYIPNVTSINDLLDFYSFTSFVALKQESTGYNIFITNKIKNTYQNKQFVSVRTATLINSNKPTPVFDGAKIGPGRLPILAKISSIEKLNHAPPSRYLTSNLRRFSFTLADYNLTAPIPPNYVRINNILMDTSDFVIRKYWVDYNITNKKSNPYIAVGEKYGDIPTVRIGNKYYSRNITDNLALSTDTITSALNNETLYLANEVLYKHPDSNLKTRLDLLMNTFDNMADFENKTTDFELFRVNEFDKYENTNDLLDNITRPVSLFDFYSFTSFVGLQQPNGNVVFVTNNAINKYNNKQFVSYRTAVTKNNNPNLQGVFRGYTIPSDPNDPVNPPPILATVSTIEKMNIGIPKRYNSANMEKFEASMFRPMTIRVAEPFDSDPKEWNTDVVVGYNDTDVFTEYTNFYTPPGQYNTWLYAPENYINDLDDDKYFATLELINDVPYLVRSYNDPSLVYKFDTRV